MSCFASQVIVMNKKFSVTDRARSFGFALSGLRHAFRNEHNMWIHAAAGVLAATLGLHFEISSMEWIAVLICIGLVLMAEIFNTALEHICNLVQPDHDPRVAVIKDLAAAAVLTISITSLIVGVIVFIPKFL